jgi:membrane complex biogenesis BtpA family protein
MSRTFSLSTLFGVNRPVLGGMLLPPLLGAPRSTLSVFEIADRVVDEALAFQAAGVRGLTLENVGDNPFPRDKAADETVAAFSIIAAAVKRAVDIPIGINVMRNSWSAAMAIAAAVDAEYVRINVLGDALVSDQGVIQGCADELLRYRKYLGAEKVRIFADVDCKHGGPLTTRPLGVIARDTAYRQMADVLLVTGPDSDTPPQLSDIETVKAAVPDVPVVIASGMSDQSVDLVKACDGTTIGTFARNWDIDGPIDHDVVSKFVTRVQEL